MKIAVAVHDRDLEIFVRVGRAPWFAIFEEGEFVELRPNKHAASHDHEGGHHGGRHGNGQGGGHGHHHEHEHTEEHSPEEVELHRKDLENLSDVDVILVRVMGPNMKEALELHGIEIVKMRKKDGEKAGELVEKYLQSA